MSRNSVFLSTLTVGVLTVILTGACALPAQFGPGDAVLGVADSTFHLLAVQPGGSWSTVTHLPFGPLWDLIPSPDNKNLYLATFGMNNGVFDIAPSGAVSTVLALTGRESPATLILDGNGDLYVSGTSTMVMKYSQGVLTTFVTGIHGALFGSAIDLNNGDLLCAVGNGIVRVPTYGTPGWSWARQDPGGSQAPQGLTYDPANNWLIEPKTTKTGSQIWRYDLTLSTLITPTPTLPMTVTGFGHVTRDPTTGEFLVGGFNQTNGSLLFRYDATANTITSMVVMKHAAQASFGASVALVGSRNLSTMKPAGPGQKLTLRVSSLNGAGRSYLAALSFGFRPGITVGGRTIYLNPDALFYFSLSGGVFQNFVGILDGNGEAFPTVQIPNIPALSGQRIYASAVTVVQNTLNVVSNPIVITIQ